jgi:hypothetical protein
MMRLRRPARTSFGINTWKGRMISASVAGRPGECAARVVIAEAELFLYRAQAVVECSRHTASH